MTISYKKWNSTTTGSDGKEVSILACIQKKIDGVGVCMIPLDESNVDYQEYLEWAKINTTEPADTKTLTWDSIRATRDQILKDTDWTMTTGASVDQAQWAAYRQNIRDIPQTY